MARPSVRASRRIFGIEIDDPALLLGEGDADHARAAAGPDDVVHVDLLVGIDELGRHRSVELDPVEREPAVQLLQHIGGVERGIDGERHHALAGRESKLPKLRQSRLPSVR